MKTNSKECRCAMIERFIDDLYEGLEIFYDPQEKDHVRVPTILPDFTSDEERRRYNIDVQANIDELSTGIEFYSMIDELDKLYRILGCLKNSEE